LEIKRRKSQLSKWRLNLKRLRRIKLKKKLKLKILMKRTPRLVQLRGKERKKLRKKW
jgi:hypothetical protein